MDAVRDRSSTKPAPAAHSLARSLQQRDRSFAQNLSAVSQERRSADQRITDQRSGAIGPASQLAARRHLIADSRRDNQLCWRVGDSTKKGSRHVHRAPLKSKVDCTKSTHDRLAMRRRRLRRSWIVEHQDARRSRVYARRIRRILRHRNVDVVMNRVHGEGRSAAA